VLLSLLTALTNIFGRIYRLGSMWPSKNANAPWRTRASSVLDPVVRSPKRRRRVQDAPVEARTEDV
jgi:hypothetical protein